MSLDDWLLAPHVLSEFARASTLVMYSILIAVMRRVDSAGDTLAYARVAVLGRAMSAKPA